MVVRKCRLCWRPVTPCIVGLCLGITFSLIYVPFISEQRCFTKTDEEKQLELIKLRETKSLHVQERFARPPLQVGVDSSQNQKRAQQDNNGQNPVNNADNINKKNEPRLKLQGQGNVHDSILVGPREPGMKFHKMARPRYISTELGIREKLFVAVITSPESLDTLAVAFNKSVAHHVTKLVFFTYKKGLNYAGSGMTVVGFSQANSEHLLPLFILKYLEDHYSKTFDYYMFVSDKTYVRGEKVFDLVSDISVSEDVYMGAVQKDGKCTLDGGVIISQVSQNTFHKYLSLSDLFHLYIGRQLRAGLELRFYVYRFYNYYYYYYYIFLFFKFVGISGQVFSRHKINTPDYSTAKSNEVM